MNRIVLLAEERSLTGKGPARRLRAAGKAPAVFYGKKTEPMKLAIDIHEFKKAIDLAGSNPIFDLQVKEDGNTVSKSAILKERQIVPLDGSLVHLDFLQVYMDEAIEVTVQVEFVGKPIGVEKGGVFQAVAKELRVSCLPNDIPQIITVDVSTADVGHSIHVGDIPLPPGVTAVQDEGIALATVLAPKTGEEEAAGEEAAGEAAAE
jgi:large subunit ribosomal protein L25